MQPRQVMMRLDVQLHRRCVAAGSAQKAGHAHASDRGSCQSHELQGKQMAQQAADGATPCTAAASEGVVPSEDGPTCDWSKHQVEPHVSA